MAWMSRLKVLRTLLWARYHAAQGTTMSCWSDDHLNHCHDEPTNVIVEQAESESLEDRRGGYGLLHQARLDAAGEGHVRGTVFWISTFQHCLMIPS